MVAFAVSINGWIWVSTEARRFGSDRLQDPIQGEQFFFERRNQVRWRQVALYSEEPRMVHKALKGSCHVVRHVAKEPLPEMRVAHS
jgi:hypothetical protein